MRKLGLRWPPAAKPGEINYSFFDRFTFVHFGVGVIYALLHLSFGLSVALAMTWEAVENPLKAYVPKIFPHATADTWQNSLGDCLAVALGWILANAL